MESFSTSVVSSFDAREIELKLFNEVCEDVNTPRALACYLLINNDEHNQYIDLPSPVSNPSNSHTGTADDYMVTECLRKTTWLNLGVNPEDVAISNWHTNEAYNKVTNEIMTLRNEGLVSFPPIVERCINHAKRFISDVLGDVDSNIMDKVQQYAEFGPGATSAVTGRDVIASRKWWCDIHVTPRLYPFAKWFVGTSMWSACNNRLIVTPYNKMEFVPKDAKTHRPIGIEPHFNGLFQKGVGKVLKDLMRKRGLDLEVQADKNRGLASTAQKLGLSTIDLSAASDTVTYMVVKELLPPDWFHLLELARSDYSLIDGEPVPLEKFSSMGNAYTFELESLIFWALARASGDCDAVTFGDDIIVKSSCAATLIKCLTYLGFKTNTKKTFLTGSFFESCGTDWLDGIDIRPFYLKNDYENKTSAIIRIANKLRIYSHRRNRYYGCDIRFLHTWISTIRRDSPASKTGIPVGTGDDGLIRNFDEALPTLYSRAYNNRCGIEGYRARVWRGTPVDNTRSIEPGRYVSTLHTLEYKEPQRIHPLLTVWDPLIIGGKEVVRGSLVNYDICVQKVVTWPDIGPWY